MQQSATGLAIAGFVIGVIAVFVPIVGIFVSGVALLLVSIAALLGERVFTIATVALTGVKTFLLSPTFLAARGGEMDEFGFPLLTMIVVLALAAPIMAMVVGQAARSKAAGAAK